MLIRVRASQSLLARSWNSSSARYAAVRYFLRTSSSVPIDLPPVFQVVLISLIRSAALRYQLNELPGAEAFGGPPGGHLRFAGAAIADEQEQAVAGEDAREEILRFLEWVWADHGRAPCRNSVRSREKNARVRKRSYGERGGMEVSGAIWRLPME